MINKARSQTWNHVARFKGPFVEVCACGATRQAAQLDKPVGEWHMCAYCVTDEACAQIGYTVALP